MRAARAGPVERVLPAGQNPADDLWVTRLVDEVDTARPFHGCRRVAAELGRRREVVNRKREQWLLRAMGLEAISPKPQTTTPAPATSCTRPCRGA